MEVHHHSHTSSPPAGRAGKRWAHYFWEFLMLFLAVFCGFMAENQREHMVEHRREKEYMRSLVGDVKTDTANLNSVIFLGEAVREKLEELLFFLNNASVKDSVEKFYRLNMGVGRVVKVGFEDRTSSQLKNAGNMRLIRKGSVADSIREYWSNIKVLEDIDARLEEMRIKAGDIGVQLFHNKYYQFSNPLQPVGSGIILLPGAKLINDDPKLLAMYSNRRQMILTVLNNYVFSMKMTKLSATNLIALISKEYQLK